MIKRLFDLVLGLVGLILVLPLIVPVMLIIAMVDRQNPLFLQQRLGRSKKLFRIVKLRTMKNNQVTPFGRLLRATGIDELPQLLNILSGDMSFIGPRPITIFDMNRLGWNDDYHSQRWNCKPGLTGLAQLAPSCHRKISWFLDKKYTECASFSLDLKLLFLSGAVLFAGKSTAIKWLHSSR